MAGQVLFRLTELGQALAAEAEQPLDEQHRIAVEACSGVGLSAGDVAAVRDELREGGEQTFEELTASAVAIVEVSRCVTLHLRGLPGQCGPQARRSLGAWRCIQPSAPVAAQGAQRAHARGGCWQGLPGGSGVQLAAARTWLAGGWGEGR